MKIYKAEKDAGLADQLRACGSIAYISPLEPMQPETALAQRVLKAVASEQHPIDTLYPMKDILVTTGWNLNTDVFDRSEAWVARNTPVHHPLNFEHDEKRIIGNITTSQAVDGDYKPLSDDLAVDELPDKFHILNGSVIYRVWQDEEQQKLIDQTIAEIERGEWYVSMECVFKGFDYAVERPDGSRGIISRDESSAFLTKHLRHYGGTGVYKCAASGQEFKVGRVLRNISFSGKGLVKRPANPESLILNHVRPFVSSFADLGYITSDAEATSTVQPEKTDMSDTKTLEDRVAELLKQNEALAAQLKEKDGEAVQATIAGLRSDIVARDKKNETLEASVSALRETVGNLTKRADDADAAKAAAEEELGKLRAEKVEKARLALLTDKGATAEKAAELVTKFARFSDDEFNELVETLSAAWKPVQTTASAKTPEQVINSAKPERSEASLTTPTEDEGEDKSKVRIAKAAKLIGGSFLRYNKNVPAATQE
jgi:hypothetical protein